MFNDENVDVNMPPPPAPAAAEEEGKTSLRSIIDAARHQENLKEPIAWSKPHKHGKIFGSAAQHEPGFAIHVDEKSLPPIVDPDGNQLKAFKPPPNFRAKNVKQDPWITPVTIEDEPDKNTLPCYNKCMLYPRPNMEFSVEEYRAYCWFKRRDNQHRYVLRNASWWANDCALGVRRYPNFASVSQPQPRDELDAYYKPPNVPALEPLLAKIYNDVEQQEYQLEELLVAKRPQKGVTKLGVMDMEETVCLPGEQMPRRKSFFPNTQPGTSHKSVMRVSYVLEEEEDEDKQDEGQEEQLKVAEASAIKIWQDDAPAAATPRPTPATSRAAAVASVSPVDDKLVMPPPPTLKIEIYEDDANMPPPPPAAALKPTASAFFDADETCSTQMFNVFIKSQAVSTPKASQKQAPARQFGTLLKASSPEATAAVATAAPAAPLLPPSDEHGSETAAQPASPMLRKQLSTILETSEHGMGATTKSTLTSTASTTASTSPSLQATSHKSEQAMENTPGPTRFQRQMVSELSVVGEEPTIGSATVAAGNFQRLELWEPNAPSVPMLKSLRFQEDKTETVTRPLMACFQEDRTETLPKFPLTQPDTANASKLQMIQQPVPEMPTSYDEDDICGLFSKTPPKLKTFGTPLYAGNSKRICNQETPEVFGKSMKQLELPKKNSFEVFEDDGFALPAVKASVDKLAESFMADLSFVPETQSQAPVEGKSQAGMQKKFEIFLDETMPPPPPPPSVAPPMMNCTLPETQSDTIGPAHLTASFMKDLSSCPMPQPLSTNAPNFDIFLDESLQNMPPSPAAPPQGVEALDKLETVGPAHLTASFMKDCTALGNCPSTPGNTSTAGSSKPERSNSQSATSSAGKDYFELNAATEMFASNLSMIKNSTLLPSKVAAAPLPAAAASSSSISIPNVVVQEPPLDDERSIYYKTTPLTPKLSQNAWHESAASPRSKNFTHRKPSMDESVLNSTLASKNVNPFNVDVINSLLDSIEFSLYIEKLPNCQLQGHVKRLMPQSTLEVNGEQFEVQKIIGKGAYGCIYSGIHSKSGKKVAFKQERPTNYWEYYICLEVHSRLENEKMVFSKFSRNPLCPLLTEAFRLPVCSYPPI